MHEDAILRTTSRFCSTSKILKPNSLTTELNISESNVIKIMRANLKPGSFRLWRKRVNGRRSKHQKKSEILSIFENHKIQPHEVC